jgi:hypothetical protein
MNTDLMFWNLSKSKKIPESKKIVFQTNEGQKDGNLLKTVDFSV